MRYRWKLLILFLMMTLIPMFFMRTFGVRAITKLGRELIVRMRENRLAHVTQQLQFQLESHSSLISAGRKQIELALLMQAKEVEAAFLRPVSGPHHIYFAEDFNSGLNLPPDTTLSTSYYRVKPDNSIDFLRVSYAEQVFKTVPGVHKHKLRGDATRLAALTPVYEDLGRRLQGLVLWHLTTLENGLHSAYPGHNGMPMRLDARQQPWFRGAGENQPVWSAPFIDPETRQIVVAASMAISGKKAARRGATALVVPIGKFLARGRFSQNLTPENRTFLTYLAVNPETGQKGIQIYVQEEYSDLKHRFWRSRVDPEWLLSGDRSKYRDVLADFEAGRANARRMPYQGKDSLWVYGKATGNAFLVMIAPYEEILKGPRQAEALVQGLIGDLIAFTRIGLSVILLLAVLGAFAFSRTVTRPIQALVAGAKKLAAGQFDSRVDIRTRDEFGDMGKVFNSVGPRLAELYSMRESLSVAREVQQNLLPKRDPAVDGLDIAGKSTYCDETGGDYYDFIAPPDGQKGKIGVIVGDVSDHGIASALLMATARAFLRQRAQMPGSLESIITDVNRHLAEDVEDSGRFMTLFYAQIDSKEKNIRWVRAGHDPAIVFDPVRDSFSELGGQGLPLGVFKDSAYEEKERPLTSGQIVLIGTDGIWEATSPTGEMFGKERLRQIIRKHAGRPSAEIIDRLIAAVDAFRRQGDRKDDVTLVAVKIH